MDSWLGNRKRILVLNREDMISAEDRNAWATYFSSQGMKVIFSNGQLGMVLIHAFVFILIVQLHNFPFLEWGEEVGKAAAEFNGFLCFGSGHHEIE